MNIPSQPVGGSPSELYCIQCGYNLRGLASNRCPECGTPTAHSASTVIPWQQRKALERIRTFWRTLVLATFRPGKLATASQMPVDFSASRRFRWIVSALAALPAIIWFGAFVNQERGTGFLDIVQRPGFVPGIDAAGPEAHWWWQFAVIWSAGATFLPVIPLGIVIGLFMATGMTGLVAYMTKATELLRTRARAISEYTCAPLTFLAIPSATYVLLDLLPERDTLYLLLAVISCGLFVLPLLYWANTLVVVAKSTHSGPFRAIALGVVIPLIWFCAGVFGLAIFPGIVGLMWLMIDSLH